MNTLIVKNGNMERAPLKNCHGGVGDLDWKNVLGKKDLANHVLNYVHDNIMLPGVSIGLHSHSNDEEYYYIISGKGIMQLDDKEFEVGPGDITAVFPGGKHSLKNSGTENMRILVFSVKISR